MMKNFLLLVMLFVAGNLFATDYYVSDSEGDNSNDGLTESTPWKTLGQIFAADSLFKAGDVIHLKRGDVWYGQHLGLRSNGEEGNPIIYTDYGTGDLPEICAMATFNDTAVWTDKGNNIWTITVTKDLIGSTWNEYFRLQRLYVNDHEVMGDPDVANVGKAIPDTVKFHYDKASQLLTLYSKVDPSTLKIEISNAQYAIESIWWNIPGKVLKNVILENIKVTGGNINGINLHAAKNVTLRKLDVGDKAYVAMYFSSKTGIEDVVIDSCNIDARYDFDFSGSTTYKRGPQIGIWGRLSKNIEIKNCTFKNFTNASLRLEDYHPGQNCTGWKVHDNLFTASLAAHGGRISVCTGADSLEFYNNTIDSVSGYMHLRGNANHYHHNIIKGVKDSPIIGQRTGYGICTFGEGWDGSTINNIYENNIIMDCENAGMYLRGGGGITTDGNIFRNNIFMNNGTNNLKLAIWVEDYNGVGNVAVINNTYDNNLFYQEGSTGRIVHMYGHGFGSMDEFNAFTDNGTSASGNLRADPLFVDMAAGDYHVADTSLAINGGTTPLATVDFEGNAIPYPGTRADIGIFEHPVSPYVGVTDFYVSDSEGDDSNDGISESTPWKTLGQIFRADSLFKPGAVIHLKRGDVWYGQHLGLRVNGEEGNPITYTDYGTGNLPEICAMTTLSDTTKWTNKGNNIWEATITNAEVGSTWNAYFNLARLYINDQEVLGTYTLEDVGKNMPDKVVFNYDKGKQLLTLYSEVDPSTLKFEISNAQYAIEVIWWKTPGKRLENVNIENIKVTGGNIFGINLHASKNVLLKNLDLGDKSWVPLYISHVKDSISRNVVIDSCKFDSRYNLDFSDYKITEYKDYKHKIPGPKIGIWGRFSDNVEIKNCTFKNFTNASIRLEHYLEGQLCTNYKIHDNLFTSSLAAHGGRISICKEAESIEFYNNTIDSVCGYMHLGGNKNHYHHNIIRNVRNSPIVAQRTGYGICTFGESKWDGSTTNNIYENNVIIGCENAGIYLRGESDYNTEGNTFRNNIIMNNGSTNLKLAIWVEDYLGVGNVAVINNTFENNLFYQEGSTGRIVHMYGHGFGSMNEFNAFTDNGTSVSDNRRGDPLFVDAAAGDYHVTDSSPALWRGATPLATVDFEGNAIPYPGSLPDIGLFEHPVSNDPHVGVDQAFIKMEDISVYPNPSQGVVNLRIRNNDNTISLSMMDLTGRVVWQKQSVSGIEVNESIDLTGAAKGYYILNISNGKASVHKSIIFE